MSTVERYLKPEVVNQIKRLDLRAQFVVRGFLHGLHASPFHGFSVEFSEHRKYTPGDDPKDIDWLVYAKTDKYYVKKFESETNITGYLLVDSSASMGYTYRQELTKFDYAVCLAASLGYLMIHQQDPVGLITFDQTLRASLKPKSKRTQLPAMLGHLSRLAPGDPTDIGRCLDLASGLIRHQSLIMIMSDLLGELDPVYDALMRLRHAGHDIIVFHILDEAEVQFPFTGLVELEDPETGEKLTVDADGYRRDYAQVVATFRDELAQRLARMGIDYVPLDTSIPFDKALLEYLLKRQTRF